MEDMLSRARYHEEIELLVDDVEEFNFFKLAPTTAKRNGVGTSFAFKEDEYDEEWFLIREILSILVAIHRGQKKRLQGFK